MNCDKLCLLVINTQSQNIDLKHITQKESLILCITHKNLYNP